MNALISAASVLFATAPRDAVVRIHREFADGFLCDWMYRAGLVYPSRYGFRDACPERFDFCAATLVRAFVEARDKERYLRLAATLFRPVTEVDAPPETD